MKVFRGWEVGNEVQKLFKLRQVGGDKSCTLSTKLHPYPDGAILGRCIGEVLVASEVLSCVVLEMCSRSLLSQHKGA